MSDSTRTFIAVDLPLDLKASLGRLQQKLVPDAPQVRWVEPANCHLTLSFLGDVPNDRLAGLGHCVATALTDFRPFELVLQGLGAFPTPSRPRVVWVGLTGDHLHDLERLQQAVARASRKAGCPPADNRFSPHVTIGRIKSRQGPGPDLSPLLSRHASWQGGPCPVGEITVFASSLTPDGPTYVPLARTALNANSS